MHTQWIYLSCFCLAVLWCSVSSSNNSTRQLSTQDDFDCAGRQGFFADIESNCSLFYHCQVNWKLKLACSSNQWFNQKRLQCVDGDRKLCKNSKLYYHINNKLLNLRKISGKLLSRTRRQIETLYLPPSSINTFVVRYYLPTGSASVNEEDSFGNNGAIYLPESYRVPMNPDSEIPIPQNKKPTRTNLRNQYLNKDSTKNLPIQEQKVTTEKPVNENFSTRKPEVDKERIIHPTNGFRPSESPRNRNSNYDPRNSQIYHPRKAGSKLYHPNDYSSPSLYRETAPTERSYGYNNYRQRYLSPNNFYGDDDDDDDDDDDYDYFPRDRYPSRYPQSSSYSIYHQNSPRYPDSNPYPYSKVINLNVGRPQRPNFPERPLYSSPEGSRNGNYQNGNWEPSGNYRRPNNEDSSSQYREKPKDSQQYQDSSGYHDEQNEDISKNHKDKKPETDYYDKDDRKESPHPNQNYKTEESESDDNGNYRDQRTYSKNKEQDHVSDSNKSDGEYSKNSESYKPKDSFSENRDQESLSDYSPNNQNTEIRYEDPRGEITKRPVSDYPREVKTEVSESDDEKTSESPRYYEPREPYPGRPRIVDSDTPQRPDYYDSNQERDRDSRVIQSNKPQNIEVSSKTNFQNDDGRILVYPQRPKLEDSRNSGRPEYYKPNQQYIRPENEETKVIFPEKPRIEEVRISEDPTDSKLRSQYPAKEIIEDSRFSDRPKYEDSRNKPIESEKPIIHYLDTSNPEISKTGGIRISEDSRYEDPRNVYPQRPNHDFRNSERPLYQNHEPVRPKSSKVIIPEKPYVEEEGILHDSRNTETRPEYPEKPISEDVRIPERPEIQYPVIIDLDRPKTDKVRIQENPNYQERPRYQDSKYSQIKPELQESKDNQERPRYEDQKYSQVRPQFGEPKDLQERPRYKDSEYSQVRPELEDSKNNQERPRYEEQKYSQVSSQLGEPKDNQERTRYEDQKYTEVRPELGKSTDDQERPRYEDTKYSQVKPELEESKNNQERPRYEDQKYSEVRPELGASADNQERSKYKDPKYSEVRSEYKESKNNQEKPRYEDSKYNQEKPRYEDSKYSQERPELQESKDNQERPQYQDSKYSQVRPEYDDRRTNQEKSVYDDDSRNKKLIRPEINDPKVTYLDVETDDSRSSKKPRFQDSRNSPERPRIQEYVNEPKHKFEDSSATISPIQNSKVLYRDNSEQHQKYPETSDVVIPEHPNYKTLKISENPITNTSPKETYGYQTSTYPKTQEFRITNPVTPNYQDSEKLINTHSPDKYPNTQSEDNRKNHRYEDLREDGKDRIPSNENTKVRAYNDRQKTRIPERNRNLESIKQTDNSQRFSSNNRQKAHQTTKEPTYFNKYEDDKETTRTVVHTTPFPTSAIETTTEENISHLFEKEKFGDRIKSPSVPEQGKISKNTNNNQDVSILEINQKQVNKPDSGNTFIIPFVMYRGRSSNNKQSNPSQITRLNDKKEYSTDDAAVSYGNSNISPEKSHQNTNQRFSESNNKQEEKISEFATVSAPWTTSLTDIESIESTTEIIDSTTRRPRRRKPKRRRRKHGRRRRPKRPRLQNTTMSDDQSQIFHSYTDSPLTTFDQITTLYVTQASSDVLNKQIESDTTLKQYRNIYDTTAQYDVTTSYPTETNWPRDEEFANRPEIRNSDETEKRKMSFKHRPRYFKTRNTSTGSTPLEMPVSSEISTQKPFTFQKLDEVPMTEPMTTSRPRAVRTRSKLMREKYRKRPRLFNFGKPKSSSDYVSTIKTTSLPTTIIHQESS